MRARLFTPRPTPGAVRPAAGAVLWALALALGACAGQPAADPNAIAPPASSRSAPAKARATSPSTTSSASASPAPATTRSGGGSAVLAFAGDVHFEGSSAAALSGRLGSAFGVLQSADFAMLNLETAIT